MRKPVGILLAVIAFSCNSSKQNKQNKVDVKKGTMNVAKLTDTLIIHESTCRGCTYEYSTHFDVSDSLGMVKLERIVTTDNAGPDVTGGVVEKDLYLLPLKTGRTKIKVYKFYQKEPTATDSAQHTAYDINITN